MNEPLLVSTFFDNPNLLAVRFRQQGVATTRVMEFATTRKPDVLPGGCIVIGATILVGMVLVTIGYGLVSSLSSSPSPSSSSRASPNPPLLAISEAVPGDCQADMVWAEKLTSLGDDLMPRDELKPWYVRTLLDIPRELARRGDATGGWLRPRCSSDDVTARRQGKQFATMLWDAGADREVAIILDLPGSLAVAAATGMATQFEPVFTMENVPHPNGVVPSAQTLAAVVYWRPELVEARVKRGPKAPPVFILEGDRFAPYNNEAERFDNRSFARLPDADGLKKLGFSRILYVRQKRGAVEEADDLNELFLAYAKAGIEVRHMALESVERCEAQPTVERLPGQLAPGPRLWFWRNYGWGRPAGIVLPVADETDAGYRSMLRPAPIRVFTQFDGGQRHQSEAIDRLTASTPSSTSGSTSSYRPGSTSTSRSGSSSSSSGGSVSRSSFHSSSG